MNPSARARSWSLACIVALLTTVGGAAPLRDFATTEQFFFDTFGLEAGLPGVSVIASQQTHDGYLWVATGGGLARFDGVRFVSYRPSNTPAFSSSLVYALFEDHERTLWIGTSRGLVRQRQGRFERLEGFDAEVHALAEDRAGRLWIGTYGHGLFVREHGAVHACSAAPLTGVRYVMRLFVDSADRLWIGTDTPGVVCGERGEFRRWPTPPGLLNDRVESITEQPHGTLWFGTRSEGLVRMQANTFTSFGRADGLATLQITDLQPTADGGLWIANGKLQRLEHADSRTITTVPDVPREGVASIALDREGSIWLSAKERGLVRAGRMPYRLIAKRDGLPDDNVRSIAEDPAGQLWLAGQGVGLTRIDGEGTVSTPFARNPASSGPRPTVVLAARDGALWLGMPGAGPLRVYRDGDERTFPELRGVYGLSQGPDHAIWIGTSADGVFCHRDGRFTAVPLENGEPVPHARWFCAAPDGTIYAATWSSGFARIKDGRATLVTRRDGLPTDEVRAIYVDRENHVWLGFRGRGLALWENGRCWNPDALSQAVADHVSAIVEDARGQLWLGTPAGVMWVAKADLLAAARGRKDIAEVRIAQVNGSLRSASVWSGDQSVVCATRDGRLLFATRDGVLAVAPDHFPRSNPPPPLHVERATIEGRPADLASGLALPAGARSIAIDYTAPSFVQPGQVFFKYRLEGYDADWVEARTRRTAYYNNLPPGRYVFRVIAGSADGAWNTAGAQLAVVQQPYFHQTKWFLGLVLLGVAAVGVGLHRWSHHQLKLRLQRLEEKQAMEKERRRIAKNLHDDLGAHLTEIGLFADSIQQRAAAPELMQDMATLSERVRTLAGTLDAIVWSANPANDSLDRVSTFVCGLFQDLCRMAGIRCRIDLPEPLPPTPLSPDERSNLFLAAREAMTNLAKHSGATEAWLRVRMEGAWLHVTLEDNGRGFDPAAAECGDRNGLANMRSRLAELRGVFAVQSAPGRGTTITMHVPLPPPGAPPGHTGHPAAQPRQQPA